MSSSSIRRFGLAAAGLLAAVAMTSAQGERFEATLPFKIDASQPVAATVGPVKVSTLKITNSAPQQRRDAQSRFRMRPLSN